MDSKYNIGIYFYTTLLLTVVDNGLTFILTECKGQTLIKSESVVIKPGNDHKLTCTFSGIDVGDAAMSWIKQAEGKALEWISYISAPSGRDKYYSKTVEVLNHLITVQTQNMLLQLWIKETLCLPLCVKQCIYHLFEKKKSCFV